MNHKFGITEDSIVHRYDNGCGWRLLVACRASWESRRQLGAKCATGGKRSWRVTSLVPYSSSKFEGGRWRNSRRRSHPRHWADISGSSTRCTPSRPMTLGKESVTPNVAL